MLLYSRYIHRALNKWSQKLEYQGMSIWKAFRYKSSKMERTAPASFHTPSLGDEPSYQAVKAPNNPLSAYAFFFKVTFLKTIPSTRTYDPTIKSFFDFQEMQTSIKQQQPDANFESVSKIVDTMWQSLDEAQREKYK